MDSEGAFSQSLESDWNRRPSALETCTLAVMLPYLTAKTWGAQSIAHDPRATLVAAVCGFVKYIDQSLCNIPISIESNEGNFKL